MDRWLGVAALVLIPALARADVVINEFVSDLAGPDIGYEWLELYNTGTTTVDLSGWSLERAKSVWEVVYLFPDGTTIAPGAYLVVGDALVPEADLKLEVDLSLDLGSGGTNADGVRLVDDTAAVRDTVIYGTPNSDALADDVADPAVSLGPTPVDGQSAARAPDGTDSDGSADDFILLDVPTPGASNGVRPKYCDTAAALVINELLTDPDGDDDGHEWVEIYNGTGAAVDASRWRIESGTASFSNRATLPDGTTIAAGAWVVVGASGAVPGADVVATGLTLGDGVTDADGVRLADCEGGVIDTVIYGSPNTDGWQDDLGAATSLAPTPSTDATLARRPDGTDTDRSGDDFAVALFPTPGETNDQEAPCKAPDGVSVRINELLPNPVGADGTDEWVELYNAGDASVDLSGWVLEAASSTFGPRLVFPDVSLGAGQLLLVGGTSVGGADVTWDGDAVIPDGADGDGVRLTDCLGRVLDTVVYGGNNHDGIVDDSGSAAATWAPTPPEGASLARLQDGWDTDDCLVDFVVDAAPTPGASNPEREPIVCMPSGGAVVINEVMVDPAGSDAGLEWVELYNASGAAVSVEGWVLTLAELPEDFARSDLVLPSGAAIPAGGFLVVGDSSVAEADVVLAMSIGNGAGGDAVYLFDCAGTHLDSVAYGNGNADGMIDDLGVAADLAPLATEGASLARKVDGVDTDLAIDWMAADPPTPGAHNAAIDEKGCGCRSAAGYGFGGLGGPLLVALVVLCRRGGRMAVDELDPRP